MSTHCNILHESQVSESEKGIVATKIESTATTSSTVFEKGRFHNRKVRIVVVCREETTITAVHQEQYSCLSLHGRIASGIHFNHVEHRVASKSNATALLSAVIDERTSTDKRV